jgi:hypothetical protein
MACWEEPFTRGDDILDTIHGSSDPQGERACVDSRKLEELLSLAMAINRVAKCFSEDSEDREVCLEGLRRASEILRWKLEDIDITGALQDLEVFLRSPYVYESSYTTSDPIMLKARLSSLYRSFNVVERGEMSDHISVEIEFLSFLLAKIITSTIKNNESECRDSLKAAHIMIKEHLLNWIPLIKERISSSKTVKIMEIIENLTRKAENILG